MNICNYNKRKEKNYVHVICVYYIVYTNEIKSIYRAPCQLYADMHLWKCYDARLTSQLQQLFFLVLPTAATYKYDDEKVALAKESSPSK